ncbi:MAG: hypothetical protein FJ271_12155 [Planctomycetes bacterium]|nr:hypothetical protein [Planctomycetota bacterium]
MSIRFYCGCGKHLRARDELAGMRTACPVCGQMVGIPSLQALHRGAAGPVSVEEWEARRRLVPVEAPAANAAEPATTVETEDTPRRRFRDLLRGRGRRGKTTQRRMRALEKRWFQCLAFPFQARHLILILAVAFTAMSVVAVVHAPVAIDMSLQGDWRWLYWGLIPLVVGGYLSGFFHCVLASAAAGDVGFVRWPDVQDLLRSLLIWLVTFLAGPTLFLGAALLFWFNSGDFAWIDWLIAGELIVVGVGYWLLSLVAVHQADRLRDATPQHVAELVRRLGWRILTAATVASLAVLGHAVTATVAIAALHDNFGYGLALLFIMWLSGFFFATFFFRLLGLWCYRSRVEPMP